MRFDNVLTCLIALTDLSNNAKSLTEHLETISVGKSTATTSNNTSFKHGY